MASLDKAVIAAGLVSSLVTAIIRFARRRSLGQADHYSLLQSFASGCNLVAGVYLCVVPFIIDSTTTSAGPLDSQLKYVAFGGLALLWISIFGIWKSFDVSDLPTKSRRSGQARRVRKAKTD